nr:hypothetical protein [Actinoplanes hotanensis]
MAALVVVALLVAVAGHLFHGLQKAGPPEHLDDAPDRQRASGEQQTPPVRTQS